MLLCFGLYVYFVIFRCIIDNDPDVVNMSDDALVAALNYRNDNLASLLIERRPQKARYMFHFSHTPKAVVVEVTWEEDFILTFSRMPFLNLTPTLTCILFHIVFGEYFIIVIIVLCR